MLYFTRCERSVVCVATPLPFFVRSSQPAAFAAGATSNTFCSGKLPPSGKTFPALPGPLPASSPPVASRMPTATTAIASTDAAP